MVKWNNLWIGITVVAMSVMFSTSSVFGQADYFLISEIGSSAEMIGKGNIEGFTDAADIVFQNPAGLKTISTMSASLFTTTFLEEINYSSLAIGMDTDYGKFAYGYMISTVADIPRTAENRFAEFERIGAFDYKNAINKIGYQYTVNDAFSFGIGLNQYTNQIDNVSGSGANFDLGLVSDQLIPNTDISVSAKNIIPFFDVKYNNGSTENLPLLLILSGKREIRDFNLLQMYKLNLDFLAQVKYNQSQSMLTKSVGALFWPFSSPLMTVAVGYKEYPSANFKKNNITLGLGLHLGVLNLNYAYEKSEDIEFDNKHYFSTSIDIAK